MTFLAKTSLAATLVLAFTFTFSCSDDKDDGSGNNTGGGKGSWLTCEEYNSLLDRCYSEFAAEQNTCYQYGDHACINAVVTKSNELNKCMNMNDGLEDGFFMRFVNEAILDVEDYIRDCFGKDGIGDCPDISKPPPPGSPSGGNTPSSPLISGRASLSSPSGGDGACNGTQIAECSSYYESMNCPQNECTVRVRTKIDSFRTQIEKVCAENFSYVADGLVEKCVNEWEAKAKNEGLKPLYDKCPLF